MSAALCEAMPTSHGQKRSARRRPGSPRQAAVSDFLERVVRVALVPQLDPQVAVQPRAVPHDERLEGRGAAQLGAPHELGVVGSSTSRGSTRRSCAGFAWSHHLR